MVFGNNAVNLGLLEHEFRYKNGIRILYVSPGKVTLVRFMPGKDFCVKSMNPKIGNLHNKEKNRRYIKGFRKGTSKT